MGLLLKKDIAVDSISICQRVFGKRITVNQAPNYLLKGKYLLFVSGHVLAMVDGEVLDWTQGRRHQVKGYLKID